MSDSGPYPPPNGPQGPPPHGPQQGPPPGWYGQPPQPGPPPPWYGRPPAVPPQGPPPYDQQGWSAPDYGRPPGGKGRLIAIIASVVVVLVAITVAAVVTLSRGGGGASSPQDAAQTFIDAIKQQDCEALVAVTTDDFRDGEGVQKCKSALNKDGAGIASVLDKATITIKDTKTDGDRATVQVKVSAFGRSATQGMRLKKEGEDWKVDEFALGSGSDSTSDGTADSLSSG